MAEAAEAGNAARLAALLDATPRSAQAEAWKAKFDGLLADAILQGHIECARCLLERGADPSAPNQWGRLPLLAAARRPGNPRENGLLLLLAHKPNVLAAEKNGETALMHAASSPRDNASAVISALLPQSEPDAQNAQGQTALMLSVSNARHQPGLHELTAASNLWICDKSGKTALACAAEGSLFAGHKEPFNVIFRAMRNQMASSESDENPKNLHEFSLHAERTLAALFRAMPPVLGAGPVGAAEAVAIAKELLPFCSDAWIGNQIEDPDARAENRRGGEGMRALIHAHWEARAFAQQIKNQESMGEQSESQNDAREKTGFENPRRRL